MPSSIRRDGDHLIYRRQRTADASNAIVKRRLDSASEAVLYAGPGAFFSAPDEASFLLYRRATRSRGTGNLAALTGNWSLKYLTPLTKSR